MNLSDYQTDLQVLLNDTSAQYFQLAQLNTFINWARRRIAGQCECIRWLPPNGAGQNQTVANQEVYPFSAVNALIPAQSGMLEVVSVRMVAVASGTFKPAWRQIAWTEFESHYRAIPMTGAISEPGIWAQFGQGAAGSIYLYPIPSQANAMDWDCTMLPINLNEATDVEAIPDPWTDFVTLGALARARLAQQQYQEAAGLAKEFYEALGTARREASGSVRIMLPYGGGPA